MAATVKFIEFTQRKRMKKIESTLEREVWFENLRVFV